MRLWSIHPSYLDTKGLCGLWREALLAQQILLGPKGLTKKNSYANHPQLNRFKRCHIPDLYDIVKRYLISIWLESTCRNFDFNKYLIEGYDKFNMNYITLPVTRGQIIFEFNHLQDKLYKRDKKKMTENFVSILNTNSDMIKPHPLFGIIPGRKEDWERS